MTHSIASAGLVVLLAACAAGNATEDHTPRLDAGYGTHSRRVTTTSPDAQAFFDQGLRLEYAFNHEQALRSYETALRADSGCAMCWWGMALAAGPNINTPMTTEGARTAFAAIQAARRYAGGATALERDLIEALTLRYDTTPDAPRAPRDSAYARAMAGIAQRHADDADVLTWYAAALMNLSPWNYWEGAYDRRTPRPGTTTILGTLERALERAPDHPGACHYYIHAVEAAEPAKALPCAERLAALMPGAGHIVHMPGHIYIRVGRYADAVRANEHAVHADEQRLVDQGGAGLYAGAYYPHNYHFLAFAATMAGMRAKAMEAARTVAPKVPVALAREVYWIQNALVLPTLTALTFAQWEVVLAEPLPTPDLREAGIMARYARGAAYAALGQPDSARAELGELTRDAAAWGAPATDPIPHIARRMLTGEIALRSGRAAAAVAEFQAAAAIEDGLLYEEPPLWYAPVRHALGRALLAAGRAAEAEQAYREDLARFPENGWSLFGLAQALDAQGRSAEAQRVARRFRAAWADADVVLASSHDVLAASATVELRTGIRMRVVERGDPAGEPLVLLHGYSDSWFSFSRVLPLLGSRYRVYAVDLRGHGQSDQPRGGYAMSEMADDVLAFMDARGIARATVVGHSTGSFIARQMVRLAPERVTRLVLVASTTGINHLAHLADFRNAVPEFTDPVSPEFVREFQTSTIHHPVPAGFLEEVIAESRRLRAHVWRGVMEGMVTMPAGAALGVTAAPTLIVAGARDAVFPGEVEPLRQLFPHAAVIEYAETGHAVHWERPEWFVRDLESFLRRTPTGVTAR